MLPRQFTHCLLQPDNVDPSHDRVKVIGVFNPGVCRLGDETLIVARVVEQPTENSDCAYGSPRIDPDKGFVIDWLNKEETDCTDPRVFESTHDASLRLRFISHLRVFRSKDGKSIDAPGPHIRPQGVYEEYGIEDPRITQIGSTFYITYVAVSRHGVATALLSTTDFQSFRREGILFAPDNKDVVLFPEKVAGDYVAMHRPMPSMKFSVPKIWMARSPDLLHWGGHHELLGGGDSEQYRDRVGGGTPPVRTERGWLSVYHGSDKKPGDQGAGQYTAGAFLLDSQNPSRLVAQTDKPIMVPQKDFEKSGFLENIVFPTAVIPHDDLFYIYYGAADQNTGVAAVRQQDLFDALKLMKD